MAKSKGSEVAIWTRPQSTAAPFEGSNMSPQLQLQPAASVSIDKGKMPDLWMAGQASVWEGRVFAIKSVQEFTSHQRQQVKGITYQPASVCNKGKTTP